MNRRTAFALTLLIVLTGCEGVNPRVATRLNQQAALHGDLPFNPLAGKVITSWIDKADPQHPTMSMLYGNDIAVQFARTQPTHDYPSGSVLSLVTWNQQEDERWFGGQMPSTPRSVEIVSVTTTGNDATSFSYQAFDGSPLKRASSRGGASPADRTQFLLSQRAAVMP